LNKQKMMSVFLSVTLAMGLSPAAAFADDGQNANTSQPTIESGETGTSNGDCTLESAGDGEETASVEEAATSTSSQKSEEATASSEESSAESNSNANSLMSVTPLSSTTIDGVTYSLNGSEATITGYTGNSEELDIQSPITVNGKNYNVTAVGPNAFKGNKTIKNVTLPYTVTEVGDSAFYGATNLVRFSGIDLTNVGKRAFMNCSSLIDFRYMERVTQLGDEAFANCSSITIIELPYSCNSIGTRCFYNCGNLKTAIIFGKNIAIGKDAFKNCENLATVIFPTSTDRNVTIVNGNNPFANQGSTQMTIYASNKTTYNNLKSCQGKNIKVVLQKFVRFAGKNRYDTMNILLSNINTSFRYDTLVVASGENFPDALAGSSFCGLSFCPIILTDGKSLTKEAKDQITRLNSGDATVYILGGEAAVSDNVKNQISNIYGVSSVKRIAGKDRIETATKIYEAGKQQWGDMCIITTANNFADSLSIGPAAFLNKAPIFLASKGKLNSEQVAAIKSGGFKKVLVLGGSKAVDFDSVKSALGDSFTYMKIAGKTRYETSMNIVNWECGLGSGYAFDLNIQPFSDVLVVATGKNFPDALGAGPASGGSLAPLLLVDDSSTSEANLKSYLSSGTFDSGIIVGGKDAVSSKVETLLNTLSPVNY
jgi:putative cell wall-binding protein